MLQFKFLYMSVLIYSALAQPDGHLKSVIYKALGATSKQCMTKVNATEADLENLRNEPPFPEKSACIISCLFEKLGIVKDERFSKKGFVVALSPLIFNNGKKLEHMKNVAENCDKEINHHQVNNCQLGNEITACVYKYAPELHFKS